MSELQVEALKEATAALMNATTEKKHNFMETVELQIGLKNYDPQKDKRFSKSIKLPHIPPPREGFSSLPPSPFPSFSDEVQCGESPAVRNSKLHDDDEALKERIGAIMNDTRDKQYFTETVELSIGLKNYDPQKEKRFSGSIKLPHIPRPKEVEKFGPEYMDVESLKKINNSEKQLVSKKEKKRKKKKTKKKKN